jgi:hypothetical protein
LFFLKVGLTSLNEQAIEMMIATFVYPLLLQPLLLYFQRSPVPGKILFADPLNNHTFGRDLKSECLSTSEKSLISAPTKSAFFSICAVFNFITNQPLLRLLFVSLFHPLSPDTTGQTMIRAKADVACLAPDGNLMIRVDPSDKTTKNETNSKTTKNETNSDRSTYLFGTVTGKKCLSANTSYDPDDNDTCVFVLSPALVEVLEYRGEQEKVGVVARTRHNPYRKAIFKCLLLSREMSDLQPLAVLAIDAAVSVFEEKFVSDILLGLDLKKFADNMPIDERKSDSTWAHGTDDRDIGGSIVRESRQSLGAPAGGKIGFDHMGEVISSFRSCLVNALPGAMGE